MGPGRERPAGPRRAFSSTSLAVVWLAFETVNIAWPRSSLAPPGAPAYQVWAAPIVLVVIAAVGVSYLVRRETRTASSSAADAGCGASSPRRLTQGGGVERSGCGIRVPRPMSRGPAATSSAESVSEVEIGYRPANRHQEEP